MDDPADIDSLKQSYCLRVLSGPFAGSTFAIGDRLEVGRAGSSDVQLVAGGVSRQHAVLLRSEKGFAIIDLLSTNGTWSGEERIERKDLTPGDRFRIGDSEFVFERWPGDDDLDGPPVERVTDERAHRKTIRFRSDSKAGIVRPKSTWTGLPAVHKATRDDGKPYAGNLLADIVLYRNLRLMIVRSGRTLDPNLTKRFHELDIALRNPGQQTGTPVDQRSFARWGCELPGKLTLDDQRQDYEVQLLDIAVDGGRVRAPTVSAIQNALCWLALPLLGPAGLRTVVFMGRIVWTSEDELGLVFSGAPSWAARHKEREEAETSRVPSVQETKLAQGAPQPVAGNPIPTHRDGPGIAYEPDPPELAPEGSVFGEDDE